MGVQGLWQLLQSAGHPVTLESLEGKVLAVDVSMWMHQMTKGMRDSQGNPVPNAHLVGLYHRICKMLYYRIKPIFVFDGGVPVLKKQTIANRRKRREEASETSAKASKRLLNNILKHHAVSAVLGKAPSTSQSHITPPKSKEADIFDLKPLPEADKPSVSNEELAEAVYSDSMETERIIESEFPNLEKVDIHSEQFKSLPAEMRHEILTEMKEHRKFSIRTNFDQVPKSSEGFADFQMQKFLKMSKLSQKIDDVRKELNSQGVSDAISDEHDVETRRLASEDSAHYILIKGLSKGRQEEVAESLMKNDIDAVVKKERIDQHDFWVEKRRADSVQPLVEDYLPQNVRPVVKSEGLKSESESSDTSSETEERQITDFSAEGGFFREEDDEGEDKQSKDTSVMKEVMKLKTTDKIDLADDLSDTELQNIDLESVMDRANQVKNVTEQKLDAPEKVEDQKAVVAEESSESDSDSDFVEVENKTLEEPEEELFPASIFEPAAEEIDQQKIVAVEEKAPAEEEEVASLDDELTMSTAELEDLQAAIEVENTALRETKSQQERLATSISDQMNIEAQELVRLFGLPYVVSPMEAEAQCAFLDFTSQTNGTVTDDSDIWLFGGKNVYKNLFNARRHVEWFRSDDLEKQLLLTREKLINMALVCGSDYTPGIYGAGPVTAMEIMTEFPSEEGLHSLRLFRDWWDEAQVKGKVQQETKVKAKLRKLVLNEGFPNPDVVNAYLNPTVEDSREEFSWGRPDLDLLRQYALDKFGWNKEKSDESLLPVLKQLNLKQDSQMKLTQFFPSEMTEKRVVKSQRVKRSINYLLTSNRPSVPKPKKTVVPQKKPKIDGGFVTKKQRTQQVNLSESSSDEFDDDIDDDLLQIDLDSIESMQRTKDMKSKNKSTKNSSRARKKIP